MAAASNHQLPSTGASSTSGGIMTPSSSNNTASHASTAASNSSTANANQHPSYQLLVYLAQPATSDGPVYGRLAGQTADEHARIAFHTARAQQNLDHFDERFRS